MRTEKKRIEFASAHRLQSSRIRICIDHVSAEHKNAIVMMDNGRRDELSDEIAAIERITR